VKRIPPSPLRIGIAAVVGVLIIVGMVSISRAAPLLATERGDVRVVTVAEGLEHPWGLAFLPDGRMLVTERPGRLRAVGRDGRLSAPIAGVPAVFASGQGGLLDVALDPHFAENQLVYLSYAEPGESGVAGTAVARGRLSDGTLDDVRVIFRQWPKVVGQNHWGSRLVFAPDGTLFVTLGERFQKERAQNLDEHLGKLIRINPDGSVPDDNPFVGRDGVLPEIYSLGHRNVQGATLHPLTERLWTAEHGARGGDEINVPEGGKNYGWPIITYGRDYSGLPIGEGTAKPGLEQPIYYWDPSIAPSGMAFYTGDRIPGWQGDLFVGSLKDRLLVRLELDGTKVMHEERLLQSLRERIRDVRTGPDGYLYLLTDDADGRILRLEPAG
jgi:aldose sugar dehydrogenase